MLASNIKRLLSPPEFPEDEIKHRVAYRLHIVSLALVVLTLLYSIVWMLVQPDLLHRLIFSVAMIVVCVIVIICVRAGQVKFASHIFLASFWILVTLVAGTAGGTRAPIFSLYILAIMSAIIFSGWRVAIFYGVLTFISGATMVYLANQGLIAEPFATPMSAFLTQASVIALAILHGFVIVRDMQGNLDKAQQSLLELEDSEERFRLISSVTSDYTFSSKLNEKGELDHILLTGAFEVMTGYTPEEFIEIGGWRSTLHPDDMAQDEQDIARLRQNQPVISELRTIHKKGDIRHVRIYALPVFDETENRLIGINGGVQDITEEKHLEIQLKAYNVKLEDLVNERTNELRQAKEQLELILKNTTNALAFANQQGDLLITNPAFQEFFNVEETNAIEYILWAISDAEQLGDISEALLQTIYDGTNHRFETKIRVEESVKDLDLSLIAVESNLRENDIEHSVLLSGHDITHMKEIERFKEQFVADAVHDLATPISGMSTRLYLLKRSPEKLQEHVRALDNQVKHLKNLLEDLRTLSQIDRNMLVLNLESANINDIIQRVYDTYEPVAIDKSQSLDINLEQNLPLLTIDSRQIERVLVNLVSNAVNYTPENKNIQIQSIKKDEGVLIQIKDEGIGIGAEELEHIFERFYRSDEARASLSSGTGLGLAITKQVVELHNGTITVDSKLGEGSIFSLSLPLP